MFVSKPKFKPVRKKEKTRRCLVFVILILFLLSGTGRAEPVKGLFGMPALGKVHPSECKPVPEESGVNAVFVPPDQKTIAWFKKKGLRVFISLNVFGGIKAWSKHSDSRPVLSDGAFLAGGGHGGVCPTHPAWRSERLKEVERIAKTLGGPEGIDGIWLDFIRYPGHWESAEPSIPDSCYCPRCLARFQAERKIRIPDGLLTSKAAAWIKKNAYYSWMTWKKEQINSFVRDAKRVILKTTRKMNGRNEAGKKIILGTFVVPWRKGERGNEISYKLAQDAFQLSELVDVVSPMLYHRMCGRQTSWVGKMTDYYREKARSEVWPIVQSDIDPLAFKNVLDQVSRADAGGVLIFSASSFKRRPALWGILNSLEFPVNLIRNPDFSAVAGSPIPRGWFPERSSRIKPETDTCKVAFGSDLVGDDQFLGQHRFIAAGMNGIESWRTDTLRCEEGREYLFSALFFRKTWEDGIYPSINLWGQEFHLNNHWSAGQLQPIRTRIKCPERRENLTFRFINRYPDRTSWMGAPRLIPSDRESDALAEPAPFFDSRSFPIGIYGARIENLEQIKRLAINTVIIAGEGEALKKTIQECHRIGLRYVLAVPRDPDKLLVFLDEIEGMVRRNDVAFYVNDEPELTSFSVGRANDIQELLKERYPNVPTCMAIVRPWACRDYLESADFFMMDQYPVPFMPMTWLADSMDEAADIAGRHRLVSVIQAFGGAPGDGPEWPRLPTAEEMDCLAFLSIIHGSRGIFFYTYPVIGGTEKGRKDLGYVVGRLNRIYPWLLEPNLDIKVPVRMTSLYGLDPSGRPAVQAAVKAKGRERLMIAVNTIGTYVKAEVTFQPHPQAETSPDSVQEVFTGRGYVIKNDAITTEFKPYETKGFIWNEK